MPPIPPRSQPEPLGRRLAAHRARLGITQQELAQRLALSRNAVSLMETGESLPSERTIVLLAGRFGIEPHELVAGTDYPDAKADRLPLVAARHTAVEARLLALEHELRWVVELDARRRAEAVQVIDEELTSLARSSLDQAEQASIREARVRLRGLGHDRGAATA
jgi:transcriptional regulator with XRE-family HTH domain